MSRSITAASGNSCKTPPKRARKIKQKTAERLEDFSEKTSEENLY
jgi:hypothetical protein